MENQQEKLNFLAKLEDFIKDLPKVHVNLAIKIQSKEFTTFQSAARYLENLLSVLEQHSTFNEVCNILNDVKVHLLTKHNEETKQQLSTTTNQIMIILDLQTITKELENVFDQPNFKENQSKIQNQMKEIFMKKLSIANHQYLKVIDDFYGFCQDTSNVMGELDCIKQIFKHINRSIMSCFVQNIPNILREYLQENQNS